MLRIGVDTGGTFTDFVFVEGDQIRSFKLPSTPQNPEKAVLDGLARILEGKSDFLVQHGSTVAINTLRQRRGARTLLVTNEGFEDVLEIGRENRPRLYHLSSSRVTPLVPRRLRLGIKERRDFEGKTLVALERKSLGWLRNKVKQLAPEAIAVVLLYSHLNPESELMIAEALAFAQVPVTLSHQVLPEFREYERTSASVINAYLTAPMARYLSLLCGDEIFERGRLTVMQSNGGTVPAPVAREQPVRGLFSGPAGGVVGVNELLHQTGYQRFVSLDMGGTSTDVCLCDHGIATTKEAMIDGQPVPVEMIDIHTVGAGGGSIASIREGGLLGVGPQSAGADPGPICYGKGEEVTVTDANLFLGRLEPERFLGGEKKLYPENIGPVLEALAGELSRVAGKPCTPHEAAEGIVDIVNTNVSQAIQRISLQRGCDIRDFTLVGFGGAAGLHACDLVRSLGMPRVVVPPGPGVLSALGILRSNPVQDLSRTVMLGSQDPELESSLMATFETLEQSLRQKMADDGFSEGEIELGRSVDVRYVGQSHELNLPMESSFEERFHQLHRQRYGYSNPNLPVEVLNVRVRGTRRFPALPIPSFSLSPEEPVSGALVGEKGVFLAGRWVSTRIYLREQLLSGNRLEGPSLILEYSSTTLIPPDFRAFVDEWKNIIIEPRDT